MPILGKTMLTMNEAVAATGVSETELRRHMASGRLPSRLFCGRRRFLASDLEKFVGAPLRLMSH
jgi:predicted DNA-binding transcriptional regulator AlpA